MGRSRSSSFAWFPLGGCIWQWRAGFCEGDFGALVGWWASVLFADLGLILQSATSAAASSTHVASSSTSTHPTQTASNAAGMNGVPLAGLAVAAAAVGLMF